MAFYADPVFWVYVVLILIVVIIGYFITQGAFRSGWYGQLDRSGVPPGPLFGLVWGILYILILIAGYLADYSARVQGSPNLTTIRTFFGFQLLLNLLWTVAFFGARNVEAAFYIALLLDAMILYNMALFYTVSPVAAWLFLPYLAWVSYAVSLTYTVWKNNECSGLLKNRL